MVDEETGELLPKMRELIQTATNGQVDIMDGEEFKSTYQIMLDISKVWDELTDKQKAYLSEEVAGKNRAEVFNAIMGNADDLTRAMEMAKDSVGSVDQEMAVVMQSFEKRVELMQNAWVSLANTTVNSEFVKGVVDATTSIIQFADACGGLVPVVVALTASLTALKTVEAYNDGKFTIDTIKGIAQATTLRKIATDQATASTVALSVAEKTLIGGGIALGVMGIAYAINYIATASERARERVEDLKNEVSEISENIDRLQNLGSEFEGLKSKDNLTAEESSRLLEVQNQIKEIQPEISGYYDEQGNFIITQVSTAQELLEIEREKLKIKKQETLEASKSVMSDTIKDYEKQKEALENINKEQEKAQRIKEGNASLWDKLTYTDDSTKTVISGMANTDLNPMESVEDKVKSSRDKIQEYSKDIQQFLIDSMSLDLSWDSLGEDSANAIRKFVSEMDSQKLAEYAKQLIENKVSAEELIGVFREQAPVIEEVTSSISKMGENKELSSIGVLAEETANKMDILKVATDELSSTQDISEATMKKLIQKYPELADKIKDVETAQQALNEKMLENKFDSATQGIADLTSVLEDLEAGNGITASSFKKISETFPELLAYMNNEASLTDAIKGKMNELKDSQNSAYREMLMNSQAYYNENVKGNDQMINSISKGITELFNSLGSAYEGDLKNWESLAQGKAEIEERLINELNKAWEKHFGTLRTQFSKMETNSIIEKPTFDREKFALVNGLSEDFYFDRQKIDFAEQAFKAQEPAWIEEQKRRQDLLNKTKLLFDDIEFDPIDIKVGGTKASPKSKKNSDSKTSSYIASIFKATVDEILRGGEEVETSIGEVNTKLDNAILKGDEDLEKQLTAKMSNLQVALRDKQASMAKELEVQMGKMKQVLSQTNLFDGYNMSQLSNKDLAEVNQKLDIQINSANLSGKDQEVDRLNKLKSLVNDVGSVYVDTIQKRRELSDIWWQEENKRLEQYASNLDKFYKKKFDALDREDRELELQKSMLIEDGGRYDKEVKDADKILDINKQLYQNIVQKRELCESQIAQLRAKGFSEESDEIKELKDKWLDYEQSRLDMIREIAEARRQSAIDSAQKEMDDISYGKDNLKSLLDLTIEMLKKETEAKKEASQEQYEAKKEALEKEYKEEKKLLDDKLDLLKKEADAKKDALDKEKSEKDYNDKVIEKQKEISKIKEQIAELSNDDSISSVKKRKELEAQLAQYIKELEDIQYDRSHELQKEAIDEELKSQEDKIKEELDNLKDKYDKEKDLLEDKYKKELKEYEKYLKNQAQLKEEASKLIESKDKAFYERLKAYALEYTDMLGVEFQDCWDKAYEALDKYGSKQMGVIDVIELMTQKVINLNDELRKLNDTTYKDFVQDADISIGGDKPSSGNTGSNGSNSWTDDKYVGQETEEERNKYIDEQLKKMIALGDQMNNTPSADKETHEKLRREQEALAKTIGAFNQNGTWYITRKGKKYPIRQAVGIRHTGLQTGEVGSPWGQFKVKSNEELNKLEKGEIVINTEQSKNIMKNVKAITETAVGGEVKVVIDMHDFSITKDSLPNFEKLLKDRVPKIINDSIFSKGIKK